MIDFRSFMKFSFAVAACLTLSAPAVAQDKTMADPQLAARSGNSEASQYQGDVYLLRGFGDVFSRGLDEMGDSLRQRGIAAQVISHGSWTKALTAIRKNQRLYGRKPVVLIGHSLGANAAIRLAGALKRDRIKVSYMATFAATAPEPVPSNVRQVTNFYFKSDGWGKKLVRGPGFRGVLKNIDFSTSKTIGHFNIDEQEQLQRQVLQNVFRHVKPSKRRLADS